MMVKPCVLKVRKGYRALDEKEWSLDELRAFYLPDRKFVTSVKPHIDHRRYDLRTGKEVR